MTIASISLTELFDKMRIGASITLIDVRTPSEYEHVYVACAKKVPLDRLHPEKVVEDREATSPVLSRMPWNCFQVMRLAPILLKLERSRMLRSEE
jgi:hypothetical protein